MTEKAAIKWVKDNLSVAIKQAIEGTNYTEDWLGAMAYRETGFLILRYAKNGYSLGQVLSLMKGDYSQRPGEKERQYHGFGFWQIDIDSYPDFVRSGNWKDPFKCVAMSVSVLEEKRKYLINQFPKLTGAALENAITAAYNCGQGNVKKALIAGKDVDRYTHQSNYSKEVRRFREIYKIV